MNCEAVKTDFDSLETARKGFLNQAQKSRSGVEVRSPFSPAYTPSNLVGGLERSGIRINSRTQDVHLEFGFARCQVLRGLLTYARRNIPFLIYVEIPTPKEPLSS
jgi:hypothetical protein